MDPNDFPVFKGLNSTEISNFTAACEEETFAAGTEIITRGARGTKVFFLLQGRLRICVDAGCEQVLAELDPGAIFGEMELLTDKPRTASVRAVTDVKAWGLEFETLRERIRDNDTAALKVMFNVARILALRLEAMVDKLVEIESGTVELRSEDLRDFRRKLFSDWTL
jgi:cGMP-dependent protein kinase 2